MTAGAANAPEALKRVKTYEWGKEVIPGVTAQGTPGHTPGHTSFVIASGSDSVYVQSDVTHVPFLFVRHPDWHVFYDQDAGMAETNRRKVYDMLAADRMRVQGFHYPFPSLASPPAGSCTPELRSWASPPAGRSTWRP